MAKTTPEAISQTIAEALEQSARAFRNMGESSFFTNILFGAAKLIRNGKRQRGFAILRQWTPIAEIEVSPGHQGLDVKIITIPNDDTSN